LGLLLLLLVIARMDVALAAPSVTLEPASQPTITLTPAFSSADDVVMPLRLTGAGHCVTIRAILRQRTTRLKAELEDKVLVDCTDTSIEFNGEYVVLDLAFTAPKVRQYSRFEWEFIACEEDTDCTAIGMVEFSVIPDELLDPIVKWAQANTLFVHDQAGELQAFLDANRIEYYESKRLLPKDTLVISLLVVRTAEAANIDRLIPDHSKQRVILFREYATELPLIWTALHAHKPVLDVRMPIVGLLRQDAGVKKLFHELFIRSMTQTTGRVIESGIHVSE
jgi:hypothetical protein